MQRISNALIHHEHSQALTGISRRPNWICDTHLHFLHKNKEQVFSHRHFHSPNRSTKQIALNPLPNWLFEHLKITSKRWQTNNMLWRDRSHTVLDVFDDTKTHSTSSHQWAGWNVLLNPYQYTAKVQAKKKSHDCSKSQIMSCFWICCWGDFNSKTPVL